MIGMAGVVVGYPLDTIKVHLQTQDYKNPKYRGTWNCFTTILKQESFYGLYKGMTSPMAGVAVVNAIAFGVYGNVQRLISNDKESFTSVTIAGASAGFCQALVSSPMELAKTRMQLKQDCVKPVNFHHVVHQRGNQSLNLTGSRAMTVDALSYSSSVSMKPYKSPMDCLVRIHRQEGLRGVYKGCLITVIRDVPSFGIYFGTYEYFYQSLSRSSSSQALSIILAGGLSGTASWVLTYPIDVVKTRIQNDGHDGTPKNYKGIMHCFMKSYKSEGIKVFTRGLNSTIIRAFPTNAATFFVADMTFKAFGPSMGLSKDLAKDNNSHDSEQGCGIFVQDERQYLPSCAEASLW
ncbi:hypothetical protein CHUAL_003041 [Chamberlinius hualienensis]